jgi:hypothetical protein
MVMKKKSPANNYQQPSFFSEAERKNHEASQQATLNRSRSLSIGTAFGGITEVSMRANNGKVLWCALQPVEVIELIHQLAANIGCHINVLPRRDFASWRDWKYTEDELAHYRGVQQAPAIGWPPHSNDIAPHSQVGANLPPPEQQPGMKFTAKEQQNVVATEKTVNRRNSKRAAKTS